MVRVFLLAALFAGLALSVVSFDASSSTRRALAIAHAARASSDEAVRSRMLTQSEQALDRAWSRPLAWHAGAMEARSWVAALNGALPQSATYAETSVAHSPLSAISWLRLAALEQEGVASRACNVGQCLDQSWRAAKALAFDDACTRLQVAHRAGVLSPDDPRLHSVVQGVYYGRNALLRCVAFAPPEIKFQLLMEYQARR